MADITVFARLTGLANVPACMWLVLAICALAPQGGPAHAADELVMELAVPTVTVFAGDVLSEELLTTKRFRLRSSIASSYVRSVQGAVGLAARRTLVAGRPIPVNGIAAPFIVKEGRRVRIVFRSGGLEISAAGLALQSGGEGDIVGARNVDSGRTVRGTVAADGSIVVGEGT
jgi:flagellar basal body P-ring formation protein FlgA